MGDDDGGFGARLSAERRFAELSQQELAQRSGLSVRAIRDLERGRTRWPYRDSLNRLADALGLRDSARGEFIAAAGRRLVRPAAGDGVKIGGTGSRRPTTDRIVPRQLPAPVPGFTGRLDQLAILSQLLDQPGGTALVTAIGGTAGVGKTALAVHWAHRVAGEFPDGQLFVNLRGFDPSAAPTTAVDAVRVLLDALGISADRLPATADGQFGLYRSLLAGKRMLVVLDNASEAAQVRPLLPGSPTCRVVVTSRRQLTALTAVDAARSLVLDVLTEAEALQLLRHRLGDDRIAAEPAAVISIINSCARLPLALCVIAARAAMRPDAPLTQVAVDVADDRSLDPFSDASDPAADVRAAFSWSYRQLDPAAARTFRLAGLHPGLGLERFAVAALTGTTAAQADRTLEILAGSSLVQRAAQGRYTMHDLLRGYACELAAGSDSADDRRAALTRLLDYYLGAAAAAMDVAFPAERHRRPDIGPRPAEVPSWPSEATALAWLDAHRADLVAAAAHASRRGWPDQAIQLAVVLSRYLSNGAHFAESLAVHNSAYLAASQTGDRAAEAAALREIGNVDLRQGRFDQAADYLAQALALCHEISDWSGQARILANLGIADLLRGRSRQATDHFEQSLALHRRLGDRAGEARALGNLGFVALRQGRYSDADDYLTRSLALSGKIRDRGGEARALANLGEVELNRRNYGPATKNLTRALAISREIGDRTSEADTLASLGIIDLRQHRCSEATASLRQALAICQEVGDVPGQAIALNGLGEVLVAQLRLADARAQHAAALALAGQAGEKYEQARAHAGLASAYAASGEFGEAHEHWQEALARYAELGAPEAEEIRSRLAAPATHLSF